MTTTPLTDEEIRAARALCERAAPGPWTASSHGTMPDGSANPEWFASGFGGSIAMRLTEPTARFIAESRTLVPRLLDELERNDREPRIPLTDDQRRDFAACAAACGMTLERWILECAAVQAAHVIDALQAPARQRRAASSAENETINAVHRARRAARRIAKGSEP